MQCAVVSVTKIDVALSKLMNQFRLSGNKKALIDAVPHKLCFYKFNFDTIRKPAFKFGAVNFADKKLPLPATGALD